MKYIFVASGLGITPFRSILQSLLLTRKQAAIHLYYFVSSEKEILYKSLLDDAKEQLHVHLHIIVLAKHTHVARFKEMITADSLPLESSESVKYYVAGSSSFVLDCQQALLEKEIPLDAIVTDIFTGYD